MTMIPSSSPASTKPGEPLTKFARPPVCRISPFHPLGGRLIHNQRKPQAVGDPMPAVVVDEAENVDVKGGRQTKQ